MPPKPKITRQMILDAAFNIARNEGVDKITARSISEQLRCSTQPVLYYYATVDEIKKEAYNMADEYHSNYIMNMANDYGNPMLTIGMNYIRFAIEERNLFHFLFQTNGFSGESIISLIDSEDNFPVLEILQQELNTAPEEAKNIFSTLFIFAHGYASLYANNNMNYNEETVVSALEKAFTGAVYAVNQEKTIK